MKHQDLAPFAVADGLLAKMEQQEPGRATDAERQYMLDKARENLVRALDVTPEQAGKIMHNAALRGDLTEQYSAQFAVITWRAASCTCSAGRRSAAPSTPSTTRPPGSVIIPTISTA
jgi:hypothetical protein